MSRTWRLFVPSLEEAAGAEVALPSDEAKHARQVLRLRIGDTVALFNGRGAEWRARLDTLDRSGGQATLLEPVETPAPDPALRCEVFQGLLRSDRMDWVVQKCTEVGVTAIRAFASSQSERYRPPASRLDRWRRIAVESCKQSGRRHLPEIDFCPGPPAAEEGNLDLLLDVAETAPPLGSVLAGGFPGSVRLAIGPASGFEASEVADWRAAGWRPASLGPRVLRAETAGLVAASIVLHRLADLGIAPEV